MMNFNAAVYYFTCCIYMATPGCHIDSGKYMASVRKGVATGKKDGKYYMHTVYLMTFLSVHHVQYQQMIKTVNCTNDRHAINKDHVSSKSDCRDKTDIT